MAAVKPESGVKPEPGIKLEPADVGPSPAAMSEDDLYEDAGDLEFVDLDPNTNTTAASIYLTHVPKYLYDVWADLDDDAEIQIGTVRQWSEPGKGKNGEPKQCISLLLDHTQAKHQAIPKEYNLDVKDMALPNTYMFTEQDLPGFKSKPQGANNNIPPHLRRAHEQKYQEKSEDKIQQDGVHKKKWQPRYRKAIPKKTVLAGRFRHELNCHPVWTDETKHVMKMMNDDAMKPKATTTIVTGRDPIGVIVAGAHTSNDQFSNFIKNTPEVKKIKKQKEEKAARMSQNDLRDRIFECYEKYAFWSLKAFKQTLNQPETWLRENLEELAVLHKSGRFSNYWELKPEYKRATAQSIEGAPPSPAPDDSESDADDENVEMEDVV
ncbi:Uu.00g019510.m01.CDS01 [Anthostomella pinea]|uniref:Transcription initiation factor IIF subunit beta n=1 Tax=Anthostomella pinea TaxID=933095 RepID=A0AAI8YNK4_9PEZI|nr:Uu.00g019510.m01.CDS01 [Anthostomella pinea]